MGTKMGYAPGTRIQLKDNSAYTVVQNPNTVAGIVGYASKGELNKIIPVSNTGELGVKLGYGYQSYKYNQGMYAANAVLTAGGEVEFIRPYGEEISRTDAYKRDLKTDAFVVAFDKNASLYRNGERACWAKDRKTGEPLVETSFNVKHFAATRFKTDGAAEFGVTRKINNIAETIELGNNVQFNVDASENFADSKASRLFDNVHCTDMVMFAIMNRDPSYANRAYDRYDVVTVQTPVDGVPVGYRKLVCTLASKPLFTSGDTVFIPKTDKKENIYGTAGTSAVSVLATVDDVVDNVVTILVDASEYPGTNLPDVIMFNDAENAIADGFDYLNIKTAVAGNSVKNVAAVRFGGAGDNSNTPNKPKDIVRNGSIITFRDTLNNYFYVRLMAPKPTFEKGRVDITGDLLSPGKITFDGENIRHADLYVVPGDVIQAKVLNSTVTYLMTVLSVESNKIVCSTDIQQGGTYHFDSITVDEFASADPIELADVTAIESDDANTWKYVANEVADAIQRIKSYSRVAVINDINLTDDNKYIVNGKIIVDPSAAYDYSIGDIVTIVRGDTTVATSVSDAATTSAYDKKKTYKITAINPMSGEITVNTTETSDTVLSNASYQLLNLSTTNITTYVVQTKLENDGVYGGDYADLIFVSSYSLYVSKADQSIATVGENTDNDQITSYLEFINDTDGFSVFNSEVDKSPTVLADSEIGASFMALGLAKNRYVDINFDGNPTQVFTLTDDGIIVARMFMSIRYRFNGKLYEFEGTFVPYNYNGRQLSIIEAAEYELENSGLEFVINDSGVLDYFLENNSYDLSQTVQNGTLNGSYTAIAYNDDDPAIVNDAVWTYDPQNNNSGSTLSTVWNLFVNKDASDVDMLVAAGVDINSPFTRKYETLNTQVMQAMINVCEARKDCFCLFDGVYEPDINKAVKKMISAGQLSLGRWGFIYDGRGVFTDSIYTQSQVDVMKSVQLAAIITANRQGGIWWIPPAGDEAYVPAAWGTKERFTRTYNAEDKNCDHAKLSDIHVNATRVNKDGIRIWGDFTLQMEDTAFNQVHVTMLVAGIHKIFYKYLDHKVFKLNTTVLRAQITSDLQEKLNNIKRQNPPGLIDGKVICNDTNNTPETIDQNFLFVDLKLLPPKSTRWIILRTSVESTKNGKTIKTELLEQEQ